VREVRQHPREARDAVGNIVPGTPGRYAFDDGCAGTATGRPRLHAVGRRGLHLHGPVLRTAATHSVTATDVATSSNHRYAERRGRDARSSRRPHRRCAIWSHCRRCARRTVTPSIRTANVATSYAGPFISPLRTSERHSRQITSSSRRSGLATGLQACSRADRSTQSLTATDTVTATSREPRVACGRAGSGSTLLLTVSTRRSPPALELAHGGSQRRLWNRATRLLGTVAFRDLGTRRGPSLLAFIHCR